MKYTYTWKHGRFINRPNRFIAYVDIEGTAVKCHVPNTGRLRELLPEDVEVLVSYHPDEERKTEYSLRMIKRHGVWVSIDSQAPNAIVEEAINNDVIEETRQYKKLKRESTYENSRFDFRLDEPGTCFVEVKGVTLEQDGWGFFPDAPTERGRKHIDELCKAVSEGHRGIVLFLVQHPHAQGFTPNTKMDPKFTEALIKAEKCGVEIIAYGCDVNEEEIVINRKLPVELVGRQLI